LTPDQIQQRKNLSKEQADLAELSTELLALLNQILSDDPEPKREFQQ